jgi:hypothetical protein
LLARETPIRCYSPAPPKKVYFAPTQKLRGAPGARKVEPSTGEVLAIQQI